MVLLLVRVAPARRDCFVHLSTGAVGDAILASHSSHSANGGPVVLQVIDGKSAPVYLAWAGQRCKGSRTQGVVEVPGVLADCLNLRDGSVVQLSHVTDSAHTTPSVVSVEPVTVDDYEILELNQRYIENHLLEQVSVITTNHSFPFYIGKSQVVQLRLVSEHAAGYALLTLQSEVIVAPKTRPKAQTHPSEVQQQEDAASLSTGGSSTGTPPVVELRVCSERHLQTATHDPKPAIMSGSTTIRNSRTVLVSLATLQALKVQEDEICVLRLPEQYKRDVEAQGWANGDGGRNAVQNPAICPHRSVLEVVRVRVASQCPDRHVVLSATLRSSLNVPEFCLLVLQSASPEVASPSTAPSQSLFLQQVHWMQPRATPERLFAVATLDAQKPLVSTVVAKKLLSNWVNTNIQLPLPLLHGSIIDIPTAEDETGQTLSFCVFFNETAETYEQKLVAAAEAKEVSVNANSSAGGRVGVGISVPVRFAFVSADNLTTASLATAKVPRNLYRVSGSISSQLQELLAPDIPLTPTSNTSQSTVKRALELSSFGGVAEVLEELKNDLIVCLDPSLLAIRNRAGTPAGSRCVLLTGGAGCGKSSISAAVCGHMQEHHLVHTGWISCDQWVGKPVNDILEQFVRVLTVAIQRWPSVVVLDDIDKIIPVVPDSDLPGQLRVKHILARLSDVVSAASTKFRQIPFAILATCTSSTPNPALHNTRLFTKVIKLPAVDAPARIDILNKCLKAYGTVTLHEEVTLADIALVTEGYVGRDLRQLISRTMHAVAVRASDCHGPSQFTVIAEDLTAALEGFVPGSLRNVTLQKSDISWADIGGLTHAKSMLKETLELPSKFRDIFAQVPLKLRSGLLLYGPPGCGKTLLASAVAKECGLNFISVKGPELLNKYIGQSEQGVRDVFDRAATAAPAILFFDEFEAIAPKRGGESTGVTDRVVNQFLCQLDGVEGRSGVYVLAASSRPDMIDPALLRPGRLDKAIYLGMPDTAERQSILQAVSRGLTLAADVDLKSVAASTEGFTGADLQAIVSNAQLAHVHDLLDSKTTDSKQPSDAITALHMQNALKGARRSLSPQDVSRYKAIYDRFITDKTDKPQGFDPKGKLKTAQA